MAIVAGLVTLLLFPTPTLAQRKEFTEEEKELVKSSLQEKFDIEETDPVFDSSRSIVLEFLEAFPAAEVEVDEDQLAEGVILAAVKYADQDQAFPVFVAETPEGIEDDYAMGLFADPENAVFVTVATVQEQKQPSEGNTMKIDQLADTDGRTVQLIITSENYLIECPIPKSVSSQV